ncbi:carboxypeptidase-like regulatory domain-containing protein [Desulfuromonas acetoxidans]|uniref:carboxypeptidase-like regulatory domain-containing protein n=1 Tax=Desulfuromonas acetoxidans TaxID=891 RepID=UPI0029300C79|nr:carboxypeptidase-like regulatory domain-containing protein [Desulfuromonas acetoxidans]
MRNSLFFLLIVLLLSGCIPRTKTDIPAFSGTLVDSNSGLPLASVAIDEQAEPTPEGWTGQSLRSDDNGQFSFPAVTSGTVYQLPAPGAGWPVSRTLTFHKEGYRDTTCRCTNMSLFGKENRAVIALVRIDQSELSTEEPLLLHLNDSIVCQAFVGSQVLYQDTLYLIGEIYRQGQYDGNPLLLTLRSVPPNEGGIVLAVEDYRVQLAPPVQPAEE